MTVISPKIWTGLDRSGSAWSGPARPGCKPKTSPGPIIANQNKKWPKTWPGP